NLHAGALDACDFAFGLLHHFGLVALALAITQVHAQKHRRPVLSLGAAAARLDIDETGIGIHRIVEHPTEFHVADRPLERLDVLRYGDERRVIALAAGELEEFSAVLQPRAEVRERADDALELFSLFAELLRALRVAPDARVFERLCNRSEPLRLEVEVKDTSADRQHAAAIRRAYWRPG